MKKSFFVMALLVIFAPAVWAQQPILIINGVRIDKCQDAHAVTTSYQLALPDIDRAAIENIEVVKGAAAAKTYGPDAVNGVITITTKPGTVVTPTLCMAPKPQPCYVVDGVEVEPGCLSSGAARPAGGGGSPWRPAWRPPPSSARSPSR